MGELSLDTMGDATLRGLLLHLGAPTGGGRTAYLARLRGMGYTSVHGSAVSADGLVWTDGVNIKWPSPQRYDCHSQAIWDEALHAYVATTRDGFSGGAGRTIGIQRSKGGEFAWDDSKAPAETMEGDADHQLYSQVTFPWHNLYLGIVMVYDQV